MPSDTREELEQKEPDSEITKKEKKRQKERYGKIGRFLTFEGPIFRPKVDEGAYNYRKRNYFGAWAARKKSYTNTKNG